MTLLLILHMSLCRTCVSNGRKEWYWFWRSV